MLHRVASLRRIPTSLLTFSALKKTSFFRGRQVEKGWVNALLPCRSLCTFHVFKYIGVRQLEPPSLCVLWPPAGRKLSQLHATSLDGTEEEWSDGRVVEEKDGVAGLIPNQIALVQAGFLPV